MISKFLTMLFLLATTATAMANETVKIVVPFPPGGPTDVIARAVERSLTTNMPGYTFVLEHKVGAAGLIGTRTVAQNKNKETVLMVNASSVVSNSLRSDAGYNIHDDFNQVAYLGSLSFALTTGVDSPFKSIRDFVKFDPKKDINYGSAGVGTGSHITMEVLKLRTGKNLVHVPYKGEGPALTDVMGGQIPLIITGTSNAIKHPDRLRLLAVTGTQRSPLAPSVPTLAESGITGFENPVQMFMVFSNKTANPDTLKKIQAVLVKELTNPTTAKPYTDVGIDINTKKITDFNDLILGDIVRIRSVFDKIQP
jgi:tripartite-type tricarboxylate transporter receptor subunit TctC